MLYFHHMVKLSLAYISHDVVTNHDKLLMATTVGIADYFYLNNLAYFLPNCLQIPVDFVLLVLQSLFVFFSWGGTSTGISAGLVTLGLCRLGTSSLSYISITGSDTWSITF